MKVYIASPYTKGDQAVNVRNSIIAGDVVREMGHLPFLPLLSHFWHLVNPHPYDYWMKMDIEWLLNCDIVLRLPGESKGADEEERIANENNIPVVYSYEELINFKE